MRLTQQIVRLRLAYQSQLAELQDRIKTLWSQIDDQSVWDDRSWNRLDELVASVQQLSASAGSFGYPDVARATCPVEVLLRGVQQQKSSPSRETRAQITTFFDSLFNRGDEDVDQPDIPWQAHLTYTSTPPDLNLVYLVSHDSELLDNLNRQVGLFGYRTRQFVELSEVDIATDSHHPVAVIVDDYPDDNLGSREPHRLSTFPFEAPLILLGNRTDIQARLAAAQIGCLAYLTKPVVISTLIDQIEHIVRQVLEGPYRVLIVDDNRHLAESYGSVLQLAGIKVKVLSEPLQMLEAIAGVRPDLILLEIYMADCNGSALARVVRQHEAYLGIPVLFLSVDSKSKRLGTTQHMGGDDLLTKPITSEQLLASTAAWAERSRRLRGMMQADSLTGLLNHSSIKDRLDVEILRAKRQGLSLSVCLLDIDHFKSINDSYGHSSGDLVIKALANLMRQRLRRSDIIGRYGGEEFAIILTHTHLDRAVTLIDEVREAFFQLRHLLNGHQVQVSFSSGVAFLNGDSTAENMLKAADEALYDAKRNGRNCVRRAS